MTDLKLRYRRSMLGILWTLLNPLLSLVILAFVFTTIFPMTIKGKDQSIANFAGYLFSGLVPWMFFANAITYGAGCIVSSEHFIKKIYIPRLIFPLVSMFSTYVNFLFSLIALFMLGLFVGLEITPALLFLPIPMINMFIMTLGMVMIFSIVAVYFRDFLFLLNVLIQLWFYVTPILYDLRSFQSQNAKLASLLMKIEYINPMYYMIIQFQDILFYNEVPQFHMVAKSTIIAFFFLLIGISLFRIYDKRIIFKL